jgi:hypothetical protein
MAKTKEIKAEIKEPERIWVTYEEVNDKQVFEIKYIDNVKMYLVEKTV